MTEGLDSLVRWCYNNFKCDVYAAWRKLCLPTFVTNANAKSPMKMQLDKADVLRALKQIGIGSKSENATQEREGIFFYLCDGHRGSTVLRLSVFHRVMSQHVKEARDQDMKEKEHERKNKPKKHDALPGLTDLSPTNDPVDLIDSPPTNDVDDLIDSPPPNDHDNVTASPPPNDPSDPVDPPATNDHDDLIDSPLPNDHDNVIGSPPQNESSHVSDPPAINDLSDVVDSSPKNEHVACPPYPHRTQYRELRTRTPELVALRTDAIDPSYSCGVSKFKHDASTKYVKILDLDSRSGDVGSLKRDVAGGHACEFEHELSCGDTGDPERDLSSAESGNLDHDSNSAGTHTLEHDVSSPRSERVAISPDLARSDGAVWCGVMLQSAFQCLGRLEATILEGKNEETATQKAKQEASRIRHMAENVEQLECRVKQLEREKFELLNQMAQHKVVNYATSQSPLKTLADLMEGKGHLSGWCHV